MKKISFIGVGIMGKSMVRNLMKAGFELHIYARTKAKVEDVISEGAIFHESIGECVSECDAVITIVGFPQDVEEVYFDEENILDCASKGAYLIDMTTTSPQIAEKIYAEGTIQERKQERYPFLSVEIRKILKHVCRFLRRWERTSITREKPEKVSTVSWQTRS